MGLDRLDRGGLRHPERVRALASCRAESSSSLSLIEVNFATIASPAWPSISLSTFLPLLRMLSRDPSRSASGDQLLDAVADDVVVGGGQRLLERSR